MINIEQVKKDFDNGVIISRETIRQVIELAASEVTVAPDQELTEGDIWKVYASLNLPHVPVMWTAVLGTIRGLNRNQQTTESGGTFMGEPVAPKASMDCFDIKSGGNSTAARKAAERIDSMHRNVVSALASIKAASEADDQMFYAFWYSHMVNEQMTGPVADVSHSAARYIWDSALKKSCAE